MRRITSSEAVKKIISNQKITFLTGAGVSTPSGVPDYRSLTGVYQGKEAPEYLLSRQAMLSEPAKFYQFVKAIYHPTAQPNIIHQELAALETLAHTWVISQNIDGLHEAAGSQHLVNFHGSLYNCYCRKCQKAVPWQEYLISDQHTACGGQIRPAIVLYGEGFGKMVLDQAVEAVTAADLLVIVGTSFQVHPFCDLIEYKQKQAQILVINQTAISLPLEYDFYQGDGAGVFEELKEYRINEN